MTPSALYAVVASCDDGRVTLGEYDALLREWLREQYAAYKDKTGMSITRLSKETGIAKADLSNTISRRAKRRRNVSKEMLAATATQFGLKMSDVFNALSALAILYERGALKLDSPAGGMAVKKEHASTSNAVAIAVSKLSARAKKKNTPEPKAQPSEGDGELSPRKS